MSVQRFLDGQRLVVPFACSADVYCRDYFLSLKRVITDFGADVSFGQAVDKLQEYYGITISASATRKITKKPAKAPDDILQDDLAHPRFKRHVGLLVRSTEQWCLS